MTPLPQRLPWVFGVDSNGVNFNQITDNFEELHHYNLVQGALIEFVNIGGSPGLDELSECMNAADISENNMFAGRFSGSGKLRLIYTFLKPILFNAYRIKTANNNPDRDPKEWTIYVTEVDEQTETVQEVDKIVSEIDDEEPRARLEMKIYGNENAVWVNKITLEITAA